MRKEEHKPLSFSTTMRNPERIVHFIGCIKEFEGEILTNSVIMSIVSKVIKDKLYKPMYISRKSYLNSIFDDEAEVFTDEQIEEIIINSPQKHKEAGFQEGWPSRFDTWYKICKEFGFIYYEMDKPIEISPSGHVLCDAYASTSENSGEKIQKIFLNALVKYQTNNPFRKNANKNAPIPLLLNVLRLLNQDPKSSGISRKELPFVTCWNNSDHEKLYEFIINFRSKFGFKASDEIVYEECLKLLQSNNRVRFKMNQITKEGVDDLIRKLRITGLFSLRGRGRFIDINKLELDTANYVISEYTDFKTFKNKYDFYTYMGTLDPIIIKTRDIEISNVDEIRINALKEFAKEYPLPIIYDELKCLQVKKASKDEYLKLIEEPTRLEFLISLVLIQKYPHYDIKPNYAIDDEGNPTFTAKGGVADIEVYDTNMDSLIEVTLMRGRDQSIAEIPAITRHLREQKDKSQENDVFSVFIAPHIHADTIYMCRFTMFQEKLGIYPYNISDFVDKVDKTKEISELKYVV